MDDRGGMNNIIGWDLGGANIKRARLENGRVLEVAQIPCPALQDRTKFDAALAEAFRHVAAPALHAVTMTGELSDVFADRQDGVHYLVSLMVAASRGTPLVFYGGEFSGDKPGFLDAAQAMRHAPSVASANWHASAVLAARHYQDGLLIDVGTTTTDLIPFRSGAPSVNGYTDGERLTEGELVYTGAVRTPVMAVAQEAPFRGRAQRIAAERFATMADVWRLTGDLPQNADPYPAPDLKGKSREESAARLARMLGRDMGEALLSEWVEIARHFAACQLRELENAARALIAREGLGTDAVVIGAGCGRFMAQHVAKRLGHSYRDFAVLIDCAPETREMAAVCAPAVAVALLSPATRGPG
jgi:probable H4MPT-linked C1 transfer pathway protein